jgi:gas vesicle protein
MRTRSKQKDLGDQEIIDLTEVVEEPSETSAKDPSLWPWDRGMPTDVSSAGTKKRTTLQDPESDEDDFDFTTLLDPSEQTSARQKPALGRNGAQGKTREESTHHNRDDDFEDIEDLFEELDLEFSAKQGPTSAAFMNDKSGKAKFGQSGVGQPEIKGTESDLMQGLETRVQALEEKITSRDRESWKDVENRIMDQLENLVQEHIRKARQSLLEEIETKSLPPHDAQQNNSIQALTQKIEDMEHYAVGPETVSALKNELWTELSQRIDEAVPQAAAKVIREEIQALLEEEAEAGAKAPQEGK